MGKLEGIDVIGGKTNGQDQHSAIWKDLYSAIKDLVSGDATVNEVSSTNDSPEFLVHIRTDNDLKITYSNDIADDIYKVERGLKGRNLVGTIIPDDKETVSKVIDWLLAVKAGEEMGMSLIANCELPSGDRWFSFAAEPLRGVDGGLTGTWWAGKDITSSITNSIKGKLSLETADLVTKMTLPSMTVTKDGQILAWNNAWMEEFKIPKTEYSNSKRMLGALLSSVQEHGQVIDEMLRSVPNGPPGTIVLKDGTPREYHVISLTKEGEDKVIVLEPFEEIQNNNGPEPLTNEPQDARSGMLMELVNIIDFIVEEQWDGMFVLDESTKVIKWDKQMEGLVHLQSSSAVGLDLKAIDENIQGLSRLKALLPSPEGATSSEVVTGPFFIEVSDVYGDHVSMEVRMFPVTTASGRVFTFWCSRLGPEQGLSYENEKDVRAIVEDENSFLAVTDKFGYIVYASEMVTNMLNGSETLGRNIVELLPDWSDPKNGSRYVDIVTPSGKERYSIGAVRISGPRTHYVFHGTPYPNDPILLTEEAHPCDLLVPDTDNEAEVEPLATKTDPPCWSRLREICYRAAEKMGAEGFEMLGEMNDVEIYADPHLVNVLLLMLDNVLDNSTDEDHIEMAFFQDSDGGRIIISNIGVISPMKRRWENGDLIGTGSFYNELETIRSILEVTDLELEVSNEDKNGLRFEIYIPNDKIRDFAS